MLIKLTVGNYKSFDKNEELSLISSCKIQTHKDHKIKIKQTNILKNAVIYGANASGKSNLVKALAFIKRTLIEGLPLNSFNDFCKNKKENETKDSFFELQFTVDDKFYAYGFTAILSKKEITEEWLYELKQDGSSKALFERENNHKPVLKEVVSPTETEKNRFDIYADDFAGHSSQLFLAEMNRGKKYEDDSKLIFFKKIYNFLINHIVLINPNIGISNTDAYYRPESLNKISTLISTFDTGISNITTKKLTVDEMAQVVGKDFISRIIEDIKTQMLISNNQHIQATCRIDNGFFNIRVNGSEEPEITTLVLKHGNSIFDFNFAEESDGTKRLFDLIDMIISKRDDIVYVVDELERSLHPKLTEHFLKLFMESHVGERVQIIFTSHEDTIMDQNLFRRDEIWFVERDKDNASKIYSLDKFKERYDKKLNKAYLEGRYGAIPVFKEFHLKKEE